MALVKQFIIDIIVNTKIGKNMAGFNKVMNMNLETLRKNNVANTTMITKGAQVGRTFRNLTHGARGFKMEMLGVMFFGMAIQRVFTGLLRPAMEAAGIFEIFGLILLDLFLPTALMLLDPLLWLMDWFMNLDESTKKGIGAFVLFAVVFGSILFLVGTLVLGLGSLAMSWGFISVLFSAGLPILITLIGVFVAVFFLVVGVIKIIYGTVQEKFKGVGMVLMGIGILLLLFVTWWALIPIAIGLAIFLIAKHWDKLKDRFGGVIDWIKDKWKSLIELFTMPFKIAGGAIGDFFSGILGSRQFGGVIPKTGPYMLHKGETVVPSGGGGNVSPTIIVNASISSDYDVRRLASELNKYWTADYERMSKGRSIV